MAKALLLLIVVASISALQYIGIIVIIDNLETVPLWAIILANGLVAHSITAVLFTAITGIEQKLEILKLRLRVVKAELSPLKDLVKIMEMSIEKETVVAVDPGSPEGDHTADTVEKDPGEDVNTSATDNGIIMEEINPRTKKPYKIPFARRMELREKALKREQDKRIKKTAEDSKKRKAARSK